MAEQTDGTQGGAAVADGAESASDQWSSLIATAIEPTPAPAPATPTVGATVEPQGSPAPTAAGDDGAKVEPTAPVTAPKPDTPTEPAKADEPAVEAKPFEFVVDGKVQAMEGAAYVPGEGVFVPDAQVPALRRMAAQSVTLERQNKELSGYKRELDGLTEWKHTGADGKETVLTGRAGVEALRVSHGAVAAALHALTSVFAESPTKYIAQNEKGEIVWNPEAFEGVRLKGEIAERDARDAVRSKFSSGRPSTPETPSTPQTQSVDWAQTGPVIVQKTAEAAGLDVSALTPEDKQFLGGMVSRFARPATAADQELNPELKLGETVIDVAFTGVVQDRLNLRQSATKAVKAAETAAPFNAAMNKGAQPPKPAAPPAKAPVGRNAPKDRTTKSANDMWSSLVDEAKSAVGSGRV